MSEENTSNDIPVNIENLMHTAYLQYSLSVNVGRAIPDVRDGLKPGNRRILYAMRQLRLSKGRPHTKCAKVVGEVIGNYHPHGDMAVYDTLVRMAQDFSMRHPLVDGQGNFGSIDGDAPAAYRYTECRMERLAEEMLADLERNTVDMIPTFDEATEEPTVLPARFPNLLVNGNTGIGVGMATNIPPHNLGEVIDATVRLIENPTASNVELMECLPGPDFPTGAYIMGTRGIRDFYETGKGSLKVRGTAEIEENKGREQIIIKEIPYALNKETLVKKIAELVNDKKIEGISGLTDASSSRVGIRIIIDVKKGAMANVVLNQLYRHTPLETTMGVQLLVIDHNQPKVMSLRQALQAYIDHRLDVITRRTRFELQKAEARAHILEGLLKAVNNIDDVVQIIRDSQNRQEAAANLSQRYDLSDRQTQAILDMRLHQLTALAMEELQEEYDQLMKQIDYYRQLLADRNMRVGVVKDELIEVRDKYAEQRRTTIVPGEQDLSMEDLIDRGVHVITLSAGGYIKRVPVETYRTQGRGGVGVRGMETKEDDYVEQLISAYSHDYILFFTDCGQMHWLKVYEIPEAPRASKGKALINLIQLGQQEHVRAMLTTPEVDKPDTYVTMCTRNGVVKKTPLDAFKHLRRRGIRAINLIAGDDLIDAKLTTGQDEILLASANGRACRFHEQGIRSSGRESQGVRGMELRGEQGEQEAYLVSMTIADPAADLLTITRNGMGKRSPIADYRVTKRGGKGVINIRLKEAEDHVVSAFQVQDDDEVLITTVKGQMVRTRVDTIRKTGRNCKGVRAIRLREGDAVSSVSPIQKLDEEDEAAEEGDAEEGDAEEATTTES